MALTSTIHRFQIQLSDVDRGVYESLDLRVAQHPSESAQRMLARVLAYALRHEEGIDFGRGLSTVEEPALWVKDLRGEVTAWIDVGFPAATRLHRASKTGARVFVYVYAPKGAAPWIAEMAKATIHRKDEIEAWSLPSELLEPLETRLDRNVSWSVTVSDGRLYVQHGDETFEGTPERLAL
ncbi:MAG TPA: hypothetical protein DEF51_03160 [Myxococcales bacterium]|nr:hypothetical protein [Myxococcales bacterium]